VVTTVWVSLYLLTAGITVWAATRVLRRAETEPGAADSEPNPAAESTFSGSGGTEPTHREMVLFGLKAMLGSMSPLTGFQLDQAIVGLFISQAALGIYVVAVAFTNLPRFVAQSVGLVAYPHVAAQSEAGRMRSVIRFALLALVLCGTVVVATEIAIPFLVPRLFGHAFRPAVGVAQILLISSLLFCLTRVLSDCARGASQPSLGTVAEVVSLVSLFPIVALMSSSGARGVAIALVIAAGFGTISIAGGLFIPGFRHRRSPVAEPSGVIIESVPPVEVKA
jgi:O-antigen/teichoic acid export membrane protein